jgi:hypothetical protein
VNVIVGPFMVFAGTVAVLRFMEHGYMSSECRRSLKESSDNWFALPQILESKNQALMDESETGSDRAYIGRILQPQETE